MSSLYLKKSTSNVLQVDGSLAVASACCCGVSCNGCDGVLPGTLDIELSGVIDDSCDCSLVDGLYTLTFEDPSNCNWQLITDHESCVYPGNFWFMNLALIGTGAPSWSIDFTIKIGSGATADVIFHYDFPSKPSCSDLNGLVIPYAARSNPNDCTFSSATCTIHL